LAIYPRRDTLVSCPGLYVDGYNCCPICNQIELIYPTSILRVNPFTGKPFHEPRANDTDEIRSLWNPFNNDDFPTYNSWFCVTNGHIFRKPAFLPGSDYAGLAAVSASGDIQREF